MVFFNVVFLSFFFRQSPRDQLIIAQFIIDFDIYIYISRRVSHKPDGTQCSAVNASSTLSEDCGATGLCDGYAVWRLGDSIQSNREKTKNKNETKREKY